MPNLAGAAADTDMSDIFGDDDNKKLDSKWSAVDQLMHKHRPNFS